MVLLDLLQRLARTHAWRLTVAHFNHRLRGRSSDADERLVRKVAARLKLPVIVAREDVRAFARARKISIEMAARQLRHEFFASVAVKRRIRTVALAHHADDQVELFFLRLLRGASSKGLAGMKWRGPSPVSSEVELVRPLLNTPKEALLEYAAEQNIRFREDASNRSLDILRNRIRHELLPVLRRRYQSAINQTILRVMDSLGAEAEFTGRTAAFWLGEAQRGGRSRRGAVLTSFARLPIAVQRRSLQMQLAELGIDFDFELVERLRIGPGKVIAVRVHSTGPGAGDALRDSSSIPAAATPEHFVLRRADGIIETRQRSTSQEFSRKRLQVELAGGAGEAAFGGRLFRWKVSSKRGSRKAHGIPDRECFDADRVGRAVILRHWLPGDRFQPIGMASTIKLQDFFINEKVPRSKRHELVVATTGKGEVFWVEGLRISERFKLTKATRWRLHWRWQQA